MRLIFLTLWLPFLPLLAKVDLWRGSMAVLFRDESVVLDVAGTEAFTSIDLEAPLPLYCEGVFRARTSSPGGTFLRSSNGVDFYFEGPGDFSIERFDKAFAVEGSVIDSALERSWLLMNLREGRLMVDARESDGMGQIVLVGPFCRILAPKAFWSIKIEYEPRNQRYDFVIACAEGQIRLTDLQGQTYTLYAGQRLAGVGTFLNPAMEIGEFTARNRDQFSSFLKLRETLPLDSLDPQAYREAMRDLPDPDPAVLERDLGAGHPERVPLVIEYAPPPGELTPFRGVIRMSEATPLETF